LEHECRGGEKLWIWSVAWRGGKSEGGRGRNNGCIELCPGKDGRSGGSKSGVWGCQLRICGGVGGWKGGGKSRVEAATQEDKKTFKLAQNNPVWGGE